MVLEKDIKNEIRRYVVSVGGFWSSVTGGIHSKPGDPDLIVCFKGRFIGLEVKVPGKNPTPIQRMRIDEIRNAGGIAEVVRSVEDVKLIFNAI